MPFWSRRKAHVREGTIPVRESRVFQHGNRAVGVVADSDEDQRAAEALSEMRSRQFEEMADRMKAERLKREAAETQTQ
jgi:hypothetical protein